MRKSNRDMRDVSLPFLKNLILFFCAVGFVSTANAGTEKLFDKATTTQQLTSSWYADSEWNINVFGAFAFTSTAYRNDRYLDVDHAWGGGVDVKYFFNRYFGLGIEGYILEAERTVIDKEGIFVTVSPGPLAIDTRSRDSRAIGSVLGTFTLRYPISRTRFAPYVYAGGGAIFGGGERDIVRSRPVPREPNAFLITTEHTSERTEAVGQFGGGLEVRLNPHVGIIQDFSWNVVNGSDNNFGMARAGLNFSF